MFFLSPRHNRQENESTGEAPSQQHSKLERGRGGAISIPKKIVDNNNINSTSHKLNNGLTKFLLNVDIMGCFGAVHVFISLENTVADLIKTAIETSLKEKRRPLLTETDAGCFDLHYSQFSLESLNPEEKLINLGSRNFFMRPKPNSKSTSHSAYSDAANPLFPFIKFMDFFL